MSQKLLEVEGLTTGFRTRAGQFVKVVRNVSLSMERGETLGLVGESGCGKTTFGMTLLGHLRPGGQVLAGSVRFEGVDVFDLPPGELASIRGQRVAVIPQSASSALTPTMRVGEQIAEVLTLHLGLAGTESQDRVLELLTQVHLPQVDELVRRFPPRALWRSTATGCHRHGLGRQARIAGARRADDRPRCDHSGAYS